MAELTRLKKTGTMLFLDTQEADGTVAVWSRIGKSTMFDLALNASVETNDFIENDMPTEDVKFYSPELAQELQCNKGDPAFDYLYEMLKSLPTGNDVEKSVLIVFAGNTAAAEDPVAFDGWETKSTLIIENFNSVEEKIKFKLKISSKKDVTVTVDAGVPTIEV